MDYPKIDNETMTVRLNQVTQYCLYAYHCSTDIDRDTVINIAIEYYYRHQYPVIYQLAVENILYHGVKAIIHNEYSEG